nr:hypothetical protein [Pedobacter sp. ASV2]
MSKTNKNLMLRLAFLVVPFIILTLVVLDSKSGGQTGGGAYDLTGLIYGLGAFCMDCRVDALDAPRLSGQ